jgi:hypothetical protein
VVGVFPKLETESAQEQKQKVLKKRNKKRSRIETRVPKSGNKKMMKTCKIRSIEFLFI